MVSKRKQKKSSVSAREIKEYAEKNNSVRISYHEKVCAERMKTLFKAIDEMRKDIKDLRADMNKGKGAVAEDNSIPKVVEVFRRYFASSCCSE